MVSSGGTPGYLRAHTHTHWYSQLVEVTRFERDSYAGYIVDFIRFLSARKA